MFLHTLFKVLLFSTLLTTSIFAEQFFNFSNVSVNYLDWSKKTEEGTTQKDFGYVTLEGGTGWDWGEFYGNINIENPTKEYRGNTTNTQRYVAFADFDINIKNGFKLHFQNFYSKSDTFYVNDFIVGAAYKYQGGSFWIKPFIGLHYTKDTYYNGLNGYMSGWVFNYNFSMLDEKFSLSQWNEIEFKRDKIFYEDGGVPIGDSKSYGLNGNLSLWWHINSDFTVGAQYRYAKYKLGNADYQSALIYTMKYNF